MDLTPAQFIVMLRAIDRAMQAAEPWLCELDGQIADGDHGVTMAEGFRAVSAALDRLDPYADFETICGAAGEAFLSAVGATAGPLYSTAFQRAGAAVRGRSSLDAAAMVAWVQAAAQGIRDRGKAEPGDKTMMDAWAPAADAAGAALAQGADLPACLTAAAAAAEAGRDTTSAMTPHKGRASRLGARAVGHIDPGAASAAIILRAMADAAAGPFSP
jgi:dihydroxyacetone kinase phosphoprotein-dependent L subunit